MAINILDVEEKTILEHQVSEFLEHYFSINQLKQLLQLKNRNNVYQFTSPKEMRMIELFYIPTDSTGKPIPGEERRQFSTKYYIPKEAWAQYLIEEEWAQYVKREVIERFSFEVQGDPNKKTMLVISEERPQSFEPEELLEKLRIHKKLQATDLLIYNEKNQQYQQVYPHYAYRARKIASCISISSPNNSRPHTFYDPSEISQILHCGLFDYDFLVLYQPQLERLPVEDRFNKYLKVVAESNPSLLSKKDGSVLPYDLFTCSYHPFEILSPDRTSLFENAKKNYRDRQALINELLLISRQMKQYYLLYRNRLPRPQLSREENEAILKIYLDVFDFVNKFNINLPESITGINPEIFNILSEAALQLIAMLHGKLYQIKEETNGIKEIPFSTR